jgi:hypothetical protein
MPLRGDARTGSRFFHSLHDGELRLNSFRPLEHYPLFVTAALSREEMLERWRRDTFTRSIGVVVLAALIGFFGKRLVDQICARAGRGRAAQGARRAGKRQPHARAASHAGRPDRAGQPAPVRRHARQ